MKALETSWGISSMLNPYLVRRVRSANVTTSGTDQRMARSIRGDLYELSIFAAVFPKSDYELTRKTRCVSLTLNEHLCCPSCVSYNISA